MITLDSARGQFGFVPFLLGWGEGGGDEGY